MGWWTGSGVDAKDFWREYDCPICGHTEETSWSTDRPLDEWSAGADCRKCGAHLIERWDGENLTVELDPNPDDDEV